MKIRSYLILSVLPLFLISGNQALAAKKEKYTVDAEAREGDAELRKNQQYAALDDAVIDKTVGDVDPKENYNAASLGSPIRRDVNLRSVQEAFDRSKDTDSVINYDYKPNKIFKVRLRQYMSTLIHLPKDEVILAISVGDSSTYEITPLGKDIPNMLSVKGIYAGTDTSLIVIGKSARIYNFYLRTDPIDSEYTPDFTVYVNTPQPATLQSFQFTEITNITHDTAAENNDSAGEDKAQLVEAVQKAARSKPDYLKTLPVSGEINTQYKIQGDRQSAVIAPYGVYDDGNFTYFDYRGQVGDQLPTLYKVVDGFDSVINYRMDKGFLVAEALGGEGWTLRSGNKSICIRPTINLIEFWQTKQRKKILAEDLPFKVKDPSPVQKTVSPTVVKSAPAKSSGNDSGDAPFALFGIAPDYTYPGSDKKSPVVKSLPLKEDSQLFPFSFFNGKVEYTYPSGGRK